MDKLTPFRQLARLCLEKGVENVIISPGSRNALLTIAFTGQKGLKCYSVSDERSAGYMAIGMALQTGKTTVLICTSGTAALNYAPAVAEAYFQEVPLLVLTADRPPEWIHQYDGQTIFQDNVYGKHVKEAFSWSADLSDTKLREVESVSNKALNSTQRSPKGPVHINIPISEPFYPSRFEETDVNPWKVVEPKAFKPEIEGVSFLKALRRYPKRLLVVGQQHDEEVGKMASEFAEKFGFVLISDSISNVSGGIKNHDHFLKKLSDKEKQTLCPDLLISTDMSLISKSLKLMLRGFEIQAHWHVQSNPAFIDPFRSLTKKVEITPLEFFQQTLNFDGLSNDENYQERWKSLEKKSSDSIRQYFEKPEFSEFHILRKLFHKIPEDSILHVGNSMSIRYVNALNSVLPSGCKVYCNRGTSGIDGCLSTAVGQALKTDKPVYCILGDVSFQYDKNALWNRYLPDNLKIIILNNSGGIIFNMIQGPSDQSSFEDYFKTMQPNKASYLAQEYGLGYFKITSSLEIEEGLRKFLTCHQKSILEIFTDYERNTLVYKKFFES
ncbi:2-succinyl-5-enolpyruvyl-6-hydroxy-3-cyclohexene-1-carboxylic-acid synthase [Jiulongibacter sediminis]|uniref:2-succinyl-5-enolpyruvyl-6-hydroxy-3- cyclohexene-1-carboxylic-acid synthase n=1 Tax=Jiulongibacter sediminis TaxID=1605367 RepID=UPI0026EA921C|nr:2-succinyl-5-enolpyruvyl-6-hydroxy-3-cyclohexene-1-carboxylic-acid synthase [Jiulongibacter sediminis]